MTTPAPNREAARPTTLAPAGRANPALPLAPNLLRFNPIRTVT